MSPPRRAHDLPLGTRPGPSTRCIPGGFPRGAIGVAVGFYLRSVLVPILVTQPLSQLSVRHLSSYVSSFAASRGDPFLKKTDT
jgi:hypothetical protein